MSAPLDREISADEASAVGLDCTGRDGHPGFPYRWSTLTVEQQDILRRHGGSAEKAAEVFTDPDDVADLVAHDATVGLPGFRRVPQVGTFQWAGEVIEPLRGPVRSAVNTVVEVVMVALAHRVVARRGDETDWTSMAQTVIAALTDSVHGPGVAHEADTLLRWWRDLSDDERALTGIDLAGTCQSEGDDNS